MSKFGRFREPSLRIFRQNHRGYKEEYFSKSIEKRQKSIKVNNWCLKVFFLEFSKKRGLAMGSKIFKNQKVFRSHESILAISPLAHS